MDALIPITTADLKKRRVRYNAFNCVFLLVGLVAFAGMVQGWLTSNSVLVYSSGLVGIIAGVMLMPIKFKPGVTCAPLTIEEKAAIVSYAEIPGVRKFLASIKGRPPIEDDLMKIEQIARQHERTETLEKFNRLLARS